MKNLVCISCPIGCHLTVYDENVNKNDPGSIRIEGNKCPRGVDYAIAEITSPARVVTATVATSSTEMPRLPVKSTSPFPKEKIQKLLALLYSITLNESLKTGDIIIPNCLESGIDVVATADYESPSGGRH